MKLRLANLSRFSLQTLFVLVALLAVGLSYVGRQYQIVRERREVLKLCPDWRWNEKCELILMGCMADREAIPWIRRMLGDEPCEIHCISLEDRALRARLLSAYPEASVGIRDARGHWEAVDRCTLK